MTAYIAKSPHACRAMLILLGTLWTAAPVRADILTYVCMGKESTFPETIEEQQELTERPATVRIEIDRQKKTMRLSGTTTADGQGALRTTTTLLDTSYPGARVIYETSFKYVLVWLSQTKNTLSVIASTHLSLSEPDAEGRALFSGNCRLPTKKE